MALFTHMEEEGGFVKKHTAVVVWAWFLLAAYQALRGSIVSVIAFSMPEGRHKREKALQYHYFGFLPVKDKCAIRQGVPALLEGIIPYPTA